MLRRSRHLGGVRGCDRLGWKRDDISDALVQLVVTRVGVSNGLVHCGRGGARSMTPHVCA